MTKNEVITNIRRMVRDQVEYHMIDVIHKIGAEVDKAVTHQVWHEINSSVYMKINAQIWYHVRNDIKSEVTDEPWYPIRKRVEDHD